MQAGAFLAATPSLEIGRLRLADVAFGGAALILVLRRRSDPKDVIEIRPLLVAAALLVTGGAIGGFFKPQGSEFSVLTSLQGSHFRFLSAGVSDVIRFTLGAPGMLLLVWLWRPQERHRRAIAAAYGAGAVVSVLKSLAEHPLGGRALGLTGHPVAFGVTSASAVFIGLGLMLESSGYRRLYGALVMVAGVQGVFSSGTRAAVLIVATGLLYMLLVTRSTRVAGTFAAAALVAIAITLVAPSVFQDSATGRRIAGESGAVVSDTGRRSVREKSFELARTHGVTGAGLEYMASPHNIPLGIIISTGAIGFSGFVVLIAWLVRSHVVHARGSPLTSAVLAWILGFYSASWVLSAGWDRFLWIQIAVFGTVAVRRAVDHPRRFTTDLPAH